MKRKIVSLVLSGVLLTTASSNLFTVFAAAETINKTVDSEVTTSTAIVDSSSSSHSVDYVKSEEKSESTTTMAIEVQRAIDNTENFYKYDMNMRLTDWEDVLAVYDAFGSINGYTLPEYYDVDGSMVPSGVTIMALMVQGEDPTNYNGVDLASLLVNSQGDKGNFGTYNYYINTHLYGMIALHNLGMDSDESVSKSIDYIKHFYEDEFDLDDWTSSGANDMTSADDMGMALMALAPYTDNTDANNLIETFKASLKDKQLSDGGWGYGTSSNTNSTAIAISGLVAVGADFDNYVVNGNDPIQYLLDSEVSSGGFTSSYSNGLADAYATKQVLIALNDYATGESFRNNIPDDINKPVFTENNAEEALETVEAIDEDDYTSSSYMAVEEARKALQEALEQNNTSDADYYELTSNLRIAIANLEEISEDEIEISFSIEGNNGYIYSPNNIVINDGDTAFKVFETICNDNGISYDVSGSGNSIYISGVDGLYEFDEGVNSGWKYAINGVELGSSIGLYVLSDGDDVEVYYVSDYTTSSGSGGTSVTTTADTELTELYDEESIESILDTEDLNLQLNKGLEYFENLEYVDFWDEFDAFLLTNESNEEYTKELIDETIENQGDYRLITDLTRNTIYLSMQGVDVTDVNGINLIDKILNSDMGKQGVNGYVFSLIVLANENIDGVYDEDIKEIIDVILTYQNENGSFSLDGNGSSNTDLTSFVLQSLSLVDDDFDEDNIIYNAEEDAVQYLETVTEAGLSNSETISQIIIALTHLGINPDNENFIYDDMSLIEQLMEYSNEDGFAHDLNGDTDAISTQQAYMALESYNRFFEKKLPVYDYANIETVVSLDYDMTRDEFVEELANFVEIEKNDEYKGYYSDVLETNEAWDEIETFTDNGIVYGIADNFYGADNLITREDVAVIIDRVFDFDSEATINDIADAYDYSAQSIEDVVGMNIMTLDNGNFNPKGNITAEDVNVIFNNLNTYK